MRSTLALFLTGAAALLMTSGNLAAQTDPDPDPMAACNAAAANGMWMGGKAYKEGDAIVSRGGNLYVCKGGAATANCGVLGFEPDIDEGAGEAWEYRMLCSYPETVETHATNLVVSNLKCQGTIAIVTLTATIRNEGPFAENTQVSFYHSASKKLIATVDFSVPGDYGEGEVSTVWKTSCVGPVLFTVDSNDDGTGRKHHFEYVDSEDTFAAKLMTCPIPKPGPLQP